MTILADEPVLQTLADLIRINSVNPNYDGGVPELAVAQYVERYFDDLGVENWRQTVYPDRPNVVVRIPGRDSSRRIVLEAHMDTVSVDGMTIEPWTPDIRDGKMFGRGACDTKGGMAAMMHAIAGLVRDQITPAVDVVFAATIDEEFSYRGVVAFCAAMEPQTLDQVPPSNTPLQADVAIVAEPTTLRAVIASKGVLRWKIETRGKSAHSSKPHLGVNAVEQMAPIITAIGEENIRLAQRVHPLLGPATCNIGLIRGGVQINFVPDRCEIELDRRVLPGETFEDILDHYQDLLRSISERNPQMDAVMHPPLLTDLPLETDIHAPAVKTMSGVLRDLGLDGTPAGVPFGSDASKFGALGIPSMILGPGSIDQAHAAVEYIDCDQVVQAAEIYRNFILQWQ